MRRVIEGYRHTTGKHCGTTSVSGMLRFYGHEFSEAMCIGLAAGLDFFYMSSPNMSPSHFWGGRQPLLEYDGFTRLGATVRVRQTQDEAEAWRWVKDELDAGRPAMVQVDIRWLDYYNTKTHFGGHKIVVVGYDDERQTARISDSEFADVQEIPLAGLAKARACSAPPWMLENDWFELEVPSQLRPLEEIVPEAIAALAERMQGDRGEHFGMAGMAKAAAELPGWGAAEDWRWCARFGYQVLEKRGTGGGNFRNLYAAFLREAAAYCGDVERLELADRMKNIAAAWTKLAYDLREISERETPGGFDEAGEQLRRLCELEREFYLSAGACACSPPMGAT
ncbi:MAG: BtrH N-terminal domain-containing protein [Candidatus Lernaella stagnicola]|nr:BtrH N-terminal domain-containing protein [Candidatus Lernaella stagnicola]